MKLCATSNTTFKLACVPLFIAIALGMAAIARAAELPVPPLIREVSPVSAKQTQTITISGRGFGTMIPYNGDSDFIQLTDITRNWNAGHSGNLVNLIVAEWTDARIVLQGFSGSYGGGWSLAAGDVLVVQVWNAQTRTGPASFTVKVRAAEPPPMPIISAVTPVLAKQTQTITISGRGFGTVIPYNGDSNFIQLSDITRNWNAGHSGNLVNLIVAEWTDSRIVLQGFSGSYGGGWSLATGDVLVVQVWNAHSGAGPASFRAEVKADDPVAQSVMTDDTPPSPPGAKIVKATIREGGTSLELPPGQMYLFGMSTGGGAPSSQFTAGQYADAKNAAGLLSDALAYGTNNQNSYSTQTAYHDIGGVSVAGSWEHFVAYYGANHQSGAHDASVSFQTNEDSLVVVLGLASSQQFVSVEGIPNLQVDASRTGGGIVIAHANVKAGSYNVVEHSKVLAAGQDPAHMADLVGVFVFGGKGSSGSAAATAAGSPTSASGSSAKGNIREVDFQNFDYSTTCLGENDPSVAVHISKGQASNQDGQFWADKPVYGNFKGDGHELAAVALSCHPADMSPNVGFSEILVFEMSERGPKLLAKLPPSFWKQARVTGLKVSNQQLTADFLEMGMGSNACPEWVVTSKLRWNGTSFVNAGQSRRKNSCAR